MKFAYRTTFTLGIIFLSLVFLMILFAFVSPSMGLQGTTKSTIISGCIFYLFAGTLLLVSASKIKKEMKEAKYSHFPE